MHSALWPELPVDLAHFTHPPRAYGILPFWFLNGELAEPEMAYQLAELRAKGMAGLILHGRYGLEKPYLGPEYLQAIRYAVAEGKKLGLQTWIYDEMNWPSGTADKKVLQARPDLAQRYIECINFTVRGPWFTYLTGADSRYNDFERSRPVAAFAIRLDGAPGTVIDLTPNLSFTDVIPWEAPPGNWRLMYIVEKQADYYIDALNPEATAEFLRRGYDPYLAAVGSELASEIAGFYTDEPAMHYYLSGADNAVVPWTKDMFRRFQERNGYNLRPRLPDLFFDLRPDSPRVRYDFYHTLTDCYSQAFYGQIHSWCRAHNTLFTGHMLYEESLRRLIRVEGNLFRHYEKMDVIGVDHLYPIIGNRDRPDEHVALKVASSAAHHLGSPRLLCESFGGIFMDTTMQRMKWIADWEYVLGVNLLNPHGFHYTLEGPRKRDWPPSQFYQYPWWKYYQQFSEYISRLSHLLSGGRHAARSAMLWPLNAMFATYLPQTHTGLADRMEADFNTLTDLLLRLHYDFDYLDEDILARGTLEEGALRVGDEVYQLLILPPLTHLKLETLAILERFCQSGGSLLGMVFLPDRAFAGQPGADLVDISGRIQALFGVEPAATQRHYRRHLGLEQVALHPGRGQARFLKTYALSRRLPLRLQRAAGCEGCPEAPGFTIEAEGETSRYFYDAPGQPRQEITAEVAAERAQVSQALQQALQALLEPQIALSSQEIFCLHRVKDARDIFFLVNPTLTHQETQVVLEGEVQPLLWDASQGSERWVVPIQVTGGKTHFSLTLPPAGSAFLLTRPLAPAWIASANLALDGVSETQATGFGAVAAGVIEVARHAKVERIEIPAQAAAKTFSLQGAWEFQPETPNALVIGKWLACEEAGAIGASGASSAEGTHSASGVNSGSGVNSASGANSGSGAYHALQVDPAGWLAMTPGAWSYQLSSEPLTPYPRAVWYRISFQAGYLPHKLEWILDGLAGSAPETYVNGQALTGTPRRSDFDSQMQAVDITPYLQLGENVLALRLVLGSATDGLLDLVKLCGDFSLEPADAGWRIAPPRRAFDPAPWNQQGYPYFSGSGIYRHTFQFSLAEAANARVFLDPAVADDVLEVRLNQQLVRLALWPPYETEITSFLREGENLLELQVTNTLVNLLEATPRPSGLAGVPTLQILPGFTFDLR